MVRIHPDPPSLSVVLGDEPEVESVSVCVTGGLAQLGEHLLCKQGVVGSIPSSSTIPALVSALALTRVRSPKGMRVNSQMECAEHTG